MLKLPRPFSKTPEERLKIKPLKWFRHVVQMGEDMELGRKWKHDQTEQS